jgi:hypothetical protein
MRKNIEATKGEGVVDSSLFPVDSVYERKFQTRYILEEEYLL